MNACIKKLHISHAYITGCRIYIGIVMLVYVKTYENMCIYVIMFCVSVFERNGHESHTSSVHLGRHCPSDSVTNLVLRRLPTYME